MAAGLGAVLPQQGLRALAFLLGSATNALSAVACPITWPALLQARPRLTALCQELAPFNSSSSSRLPAAIMQLQKQQTVATVLEPVQGVQQTVLAIIASVLGTAVDAHQPLLEVSRSLHCTCCMSMPCTSGAALPPCKHRRWAMIMLG